MSDTRIAENGTGSTGGGIIIAPTSGGSAKASIARVIVTNNVLGIRVDGSTASATSFVSVTDSVAGENTNSGLTASSLAGASALMQVTRTLSVNNGAGLNASGSALIRIGYSVVSGNATGVLITNGGAISSFGNNQISDNSTPGPTLSSIMLQ